MANIQGLFRIGRDAVLRATPDGQSVVNLALAYNYGKKQDNLTQWVDASLWGKRAEALAQYLIKGQQIYAIISDAHIETFEKQGGEQASKLVGRIDFLEFSGARPAQQEQPAPQQQRQAPPPASQGMSSIAEMDSDVPF
ncbi:MAG TPA: single-stranded DNA-binding protein [Advenella kashmirensis]|uniref:Single-stranded DNA-binding protein n=1 Tax=Advenella kashmirensis TaxID=310575 RepID=A0A356LAW7_9BURK|nr:single-stranded DNA-binding protein [Advenella kashmirensis]